MKIYRYKKGILVNGDCEEFLKKVKPGSVDLIFADPPFNIGYNYGDHYEDRLPRKDYLAWARRWLSLCKVALREGGSIYVAIGDDYVVDYKRFLDRRFSYRNWIIWHYTFGVYCESKFGRAHTHILYYTKGKGHTWNPDSIRIPSARLKDYSDKRADPRGRVPGDVWTLPRICGTFKERTGHPCQMPESVLEIIVKVSSKRNDIVLDPFSGSGTTLAVAYKSGRRFLGSEQSAGYCKGIRRRLDKCAFALGHT